MTIYAADPDEIRAKLHAAQAHRRQRPPIRRLGPTLEPTARHWKHLYPVMSFLGTH